MWYLPLTSLQNQHCLILQNEKRVRWSLKVRNQVRKLKMKFNMRWKRIHKHIESLCNQMDNLTSLSRLCMKHLPHQSTPKIICSLKNLSTWWESSSIMWIKLMTLDFMVKRKFWPTYLTESCRILFSQLLSHHMPEQVKTSWVWWLTPC